ncbi:MAG TPA: VWA domain-containing protein [Pyrinomonadaceae bacterium]|nr:VWA domain-containing protein [Pyrinomonadaceae bacterium]
MKTGALILTLALMAAVAAVGPAAARQGAAGTGAQTQEADERPLVVNADLVTVTVTVTDGEGHHVAGLGKGAFAVTDDKVPQEITFFADEDEPASVGVLFDVSGSMSGDKIERAREALAGLVRSSHPADEFFLIDFASEAKLLLDRSRDADAVLAKFTYARPRGQTALYDAVYLGVEKVMRGAHRKRALVVISDGEDNSSRHSLGELRRQLQESGVAVYAVGISMNWPPRQGAGEETLKRLAAATGGEAFFPKGSSELDVAFERIALGLRHRYAVGYRPSNFAPDGRWHRVRVRVTPPPGVKRLHVRAKEGYFADPRSFGTSYK